MKTNATMGLISVSDNNGEITVLGRDLHSALGVKTPYTIWFKRMCEYGFEENVDYVEFNDETINKTTSMFRVKTPINHRLTLSMAKEIAMLQRTPIGKKARQYFIKSDENHATYSPEQFFTLLSNWENPKVDPKFCVYLMGMANDTVKIGVSSDFYHRLNRIQSASGLCVVKYAYTDYIDKPVAYNIEKTCHMNFASFRTQGEFFTVDWKSAYDFLNSKTKIVKQACA